MSIKTLKLNQAGDTIVEVMIVLAVLGLALSISYATASRSLLNARQAQENSQAAEVLQAQIEVLRTFASNDSSNANYIYRNNPPQTFCIYNGGVVTWLNPNVPDPNCKNVNGLYTVSINYGGAPGNIFTVTASWTDVLGQGTDTSTVLYRVD